MKAVNLANRILARFNLTLVQPRLISDLQQAIDQLETDKLSLSDRLIEMDRINATLRCDAPWREYIETLEKALRIKTAKKTKK